MRSAGRFSYLWGAFVATIAAGAFATAAQAEDGGLPATVLDTGTVVATDPTVAPSDSTATNEPPTPVVDAVAVDPATGDLAPVEGAATVTDPLEPATPENVDLVSAPAQEPAAVPEQLPAAAEQLPPAELVPAPPEEISAVPVAASADSLTQPSLVDAPTVDAPTADSAGASAPVATPGREEAPSPSRSTPPQRAAPETALPPSPAPTSVEIGSLAAHVDLHAEQVLRGPEALPPDDVARRDATTLPFDSAFHTAERPALGVVAEASPARPKAGSGGSARPEDSTAVVETHQHAASTSPSGHDGAAAHPDMSLQAPAANTGAAASSSAAAGSGAASGIGGVAVLAALTALLAAALQRLGGLLSLSLAFGRGVSIASALKRPG